MTLAPDMDNAPDAKPRPSLEEYQSLLQQANALTERLRDIEGQLEGGPSVSGQNENDVAEPKGSADDAEPADASSPLVQKASEQKTDIEDRVALLEGQLSRFHFDDEKPAMTRMGSVLYRSQEDTPELTELPESTYSLLITEPMFSKPHTFGMISALLSMTCLVMSLIYSFGQGDDSNPWGLPVGVDRIVRGAQYLGKSRNQNLDAVRELTYCTFEGMIVGVFMEDEIPQGERTGKEETLRMCEEQACETIISGWLCSNIHLQALN